MKNSDSKRAILFKFLTYISTVCLLSDKFEFLKTRTKTDITEWNIWRMCLRVCLACFLCRFLLLFLFYVTRVKTSFDFAFRWLFTGLFVHDSIIIFSLVLSQRLSVFFLLFFSSGSVNILNSLFPVLNSVELSALRQNNNVQARERAPDCIRYEHTCNCNIFLFILPFIDIHFELNYSKKLIQTCDSVCFYAWLGIFFQLRGGIREKKFMVWLEFDGKVESEIKFHKTKGLFYLNIFKII